VDVEVETEDAVEVPLDVPVPVFPLAEDWFNPERFRSNVIKLIVEAEFE
jgi:hypothetical protein